MISRLPPWVEAFSFTLAAMAGSINAVALLGFGQQGVSHLTGSSSLLGIALALGDGGHAWSLLLLLLAFVFGAALSGALIDGTALRLGRRYSLVLLLEAMLLLSAMLELWQGRPLGQLLASAACGLQNAMVSTYSGASLRTTHVSGMFTDLGAMLGGRLRGQPFDRRRAQLYLLLITGFIGGGCVGALAYRRLGFGALALPAGAALALAGIYWVYRWRSRM
jgi:uncharacterized membrane protein YoaK (UPF0700 family)